MVNRSLLINCSFFVIAMATPVGAQEPDTAAARQPVDSAKLPVVSLPPLVVTVSKSPLAPNQVGFALSLITAEELDLERPVYTADVLRTVPGIFIEEAAGPGGPTIARLRGGEEVFTQILIDGVQVNENGGFFDFQGFSLSNLERVEVLRGPQSAVYGSSAVSGVINFITHRGEAGPPRFRFAGEGGDATVNGGSFRVTGEVDGGGSWLRYSGGLGTAYARGIYELPNDTWTGEGSLRIDATPSERFGLTGTFRYIDIENNLPVRDPGATRVPLDPNARNERDRIVSALNARFVQSPSWTHKLTASLYSESFLFEDQRDNVAGSGDYDFFIFDADFTLDADWTRAGFEYAGIYEFLPDADRGLALTYGGSWERETRTDRTSGEFGEGRQELDRNSLAGFVEVRTDLLPRTDLLIGTRVEKYEDLSAELTPRASLRFELGPVALRAAAGRAFKAPNLQQQYLDNPFIASNPDLKAETSTSWELGVESGADDGGVRAELTYFWQDFDDLIRSVELEGSTQQINRNLGSSRAQGVEWTLLYPLARDWLIGSEGAWVRTEVLDNSGLPDDQFPVGEELPFRPDLVGNVFVQARPASRLTATVRATYVGSQVVLSERFSGRRVELDPYVLINLRGEYEMSRRVTLYARMDNLFDVEYETAFDRVGVPFTFAFGAQFAASQRLR